MWGADMLLCCVVLWGLCWGLGMQRVKGGVEREVEVGSWNLQKCLGMELSYFYGLLVLRLYLLDWLYIRVCVWLGDECAFAMHECMYIHILIIIIILV